LKVIDTNDFEWIRDLLAAWMDYKACHPDWKRNAVADAIVGEFENLNYQDGQKNSWHYIKIT